jgi:hypothetical protein
VCLAILRHDEVVLFDLAGVPKLFTAPKDDDINRLCFDTHGCRGYDDWLTPCLDSDGLHGDPEEACFCGVDTPHLHAHSKDRCDSIHENTQIDSVEYLASKILLVRAAEDLVELSVKHAIMHNDHIDSVSRDVSTGRWKWRCETDTFQHLESLGQRTWITHGKKSIHIDFCVYYPDALLQDESNKLPLSDLISTANLEKSQCIVKNINESSNDECHWVKKECCHEYSSTTTETTQRDLCHDNVKNDSTKTECHSRKKKFCDGISAAKDSTSHTDQFKPLSQVKMNKPCCDSGCKKDSDMQCCVKKQHSEVANIECDEERTKCCNKSSAIIECTMHTALTPKSNDTMKTTSCCKSEPPTKCCSNSTFGKSSSTCQSKLYTGAKENCINSARAHSHPKTDVSFAQSQEISTAKVGRSQFFVSGICCSSEIPAINSILGPLTGVQNVSINVTTKMVYVDHDIAIIAAQSLCDHLNHEGFGADIRTDAEKVLKQSVDGLTVMSRILVTHASATALADIQDFLRSHSSVRSTEFEDNINEHSVTLTLQHDPWTLWIPHLVIEIKDKEHSLDAEVSILIDGGDPKNLLKEYSTNDKLNGEERGDGEKVSTFPRPIVMLCGVLWGISMLSLVDHWYVMELLTFNSPPYRI